MIAVAGTLGYRVRVMLNVKLKVWRERHKTACARLHIRRGSYKQDTDDLAELTHGETTDTIYK